MKYLILGHGRHGKDTVAEIMRDMYGLSFQSSSEAALSIIFPALQAALGYRHKQEAFDDRHNNRALWKELITLINTPDKTTLFSRIMETSDMYVGMRDPDEYRLTKHEVDAVLWVDGSTRRPWDHSMGITYNKEEMVLIDNNGVEGDLPDIIEEAMGKTIRTKRRYYY